MISSMTLNATCRRDGQKMLSLFRVLTLIFCGMLLQIFFPVHAAELSDSSAVTRGKHVYDRFCSLCHGANLEGQANWRSRNDDDKLPAPPHDENGHTWHHPDSVLFGIVKFGITPPYGPPGYESDMPAWGDTLSDDDIWAVLAYIKSRWPEKQRRYQEQMTEKDRKR